jgi:PAS domain S-box-containing protein
VTTGDRQGPGPRPDRDDPGEREATDADAAPRRDAAAGSDPDGEIFRLLVDRVQDYAIFLIDPDGRVASWNAGAERIKGYTAAEIVGRPYATFFTAEDRADGRPDRLLGRALSEGRVEDEGWRVRRDGSHFWADAVLTALRDADGRLRGYAKVTRDMTERRQAAEQVRLIAALRDAVEERARALAEAERRRDEAERARASLQTFLGVVAHDLRGPLTAIRAGAQLLRRRAGAPSPERLGRALESIEDETRRMDELVGHLVDAARIGAGQLEVRPAPADLAALARRAVAAAQATTERHRLVLEAPERLEGEWDPGLLARVLDNLLGNAVKYSPEGGAVRVRVGRQDDRAIVSVSDRGIGLRPEELPRLFQLFARLEAGREVEGSGLGLYIVHGIVAAHGGRIWAESPGPGAGATFTVALPLERAPGGE